MLYFDIVVGNLHVRLRAVPLTLADLRVHRSQALVYAGTCAPTKSRPLQPREKRTGTLERTKMQYKRPLARL